MELLVRERRLVVPSCHNVACSPLQSENVIYIMSRMYADLNMFPKFFPLWIYLNCYSIFILYFAIEVVHVLFTGFNLMTILRAPRSMSYKKKLKIQKEQSNSVIPRTNNTMAIVKQMTDCSTKLTDWAVPTLLKTGHDIRCCGRLSRVYSTNGTMVSQYVKALLIITLPLVNTIKLIKSLIP